MPESSLNYLNTDLDVISTQEPSAMVEALQRAGLFALHCEPNETSGEWTLGFECDGAITDDVAASPKKTILALLSAAENLQGEARVVWDSAGVRRFNIGLESAADRDVHYFDLPAEILLRAGSLSAEIRITLYGPSR